MKIFPDEQEARAILEYDRTVEHIQSESLEYDLPPEKHDVAQKYAKADPKPRSGGPYKFAKKERKPNATKEGIITELGDFLSKNSSFEVENYQIPNKEGKISFTIGGKWYTITLTEHRSKPKWCEQGVKALLPK